MAILCASEREDWPGTCLWRVFKAPICCRSLSPACYLGLIVADKGWGEGLDVHLELLSLEQLLVFVDPVALSTQDWWL